jgi:hypothetical protein
MTWYTRSKFRIPGQAKAESYLSFFSRTWALRKNRKDANAINFKENWEIFMK